MADGQEGQCELDSHADTTLAGSNMVFLDDLTQADKIDVYGRVLRQTRSYPEYTY